MSVIVGVGIDLVDISRVEGMLAERGTRLLERLFTAGERAYGERMAKPALHLAARLAAKEAAFKALSGTEDAAGIGWTEIEVINDELRRPHLVLHGRAEKRAQALSVRRMHLSMTHSDSAAAAVVILEDDR